MQLKFMQKDKPSDEIRSSFAGIFLVANTFVWYLYSCRLLSEVTLNGEFSSFQALIVWSMTILGTALASVFGFLISNNVKKSDFIRYWVLAGIPLSLIPAVKDITPIFNSMFFFSFAGIYFGLGMPVSLAYFASLTKENNRSKLGGLTFLAIFIGVLILGALGIKDPQLNAIVLAVVKIIGLAAILNIKPLENVNTQKDVTYKEVFKNKTFLLYFVPWMMFSTANYIAAPIVSQIFQPSLFESFMMTENILAGVFAVVSGFVADYVGRRRLVLAGFILLGVGYASLGLFSENIVGWWFYTITDGVAWGIFYTIFLMTIWGDIAGNSNSEKFYAIGYLPFLFSILTQLSMGTTISSTINSSAIFSFTSLFLFIAVLPLAYAPETLPFQILRKRELESYIEKAQRIKNSKGT
ncbi:MAG: MFS transporter [Candidatus Bathyarchaeia archaeon]|jgi:MFS family permease